MNNAYFSREPGYSMLPSEDGLLLRCRQTRAQLHLNRTATLTWLLCDGTLQHSEIVAQLQELYPDRAEEVATEISVLLDELLNAGRLQARPVPWKRPLLRVSFSGFWKAFEPGDNYLTWMLSFRYDVLVVQAGSIPDLIFLGSHVGPSSPEAWDPERTLGIYCGPTADRPEALPENADVDLALLWDGNDQEGQLRLPSWALVADWRHPLDDLPDHERLAPYAPQRFGERFLAALEQRAKAAATDQLLPSTSALPEGVAPTPPTATATAPTGPRLTVGMSTYDDYDGVYFTVQALVLNHPEIAASLEILIVDNHPEGPAASALQGLADALQSVRYIAFSEIRSTAVRDVIFREARAPSVLCLDSHVLLPPGAVLRLVEFLEARPESLDLLHGPLLYDDHRTLSTHFDPVWSAGMYGVWSTDNRGLDMAAPPFEIPMQGLGLFACRTQAWPGLNPHFRGFGGEEGYLHEKFRRRGGRVLCLPFLRWLHRFQRPDGIPFDNTWEDRIRNYLIGHHELGLPMAGLEAHFRELLGDTIYQRAESETLTEIASPWSTFDAVYALGVNIPDDTNSSAQQAQAQAQAQAQHRFSTACDNSGLGRLLRWDHARPSSPDPVTVDLQTATRHRRLVEQALNFGFNDILLINPCIAQPARLLKALPQVIETLRAHHSVVLIREALPQTENLPQAAAQAPPTALWAVAYPHQAFRRFCDDLPRDPEPLAARLNQVGGSFERYLESFGRIVLIP